MATKAKKKIPASKRWKETARRWLNAVIEDLKNSRNSKPARTKRGKSKQKKKNPWFKCRTPGCYRWVPSLCDHCGKGRAGITEKHTTHCCPGPCDRCRRCTLLCPGPCDKCPQCADRCPGHEEEKT